MLGNLVLFPRLYGYVPEWKRTENKSPTAGGGFVDFIVVGNYSQGNIAHGLWHEYVIKSRTFCYGSRRVLFIIVI